MKAADDCNVKIMVTPQKIEYIEDDISSHCHGKSLLSQKPKLPPSVGGREN